MKDGWAWTGLRDGRRGPGKVERGRGLETGRIMISSGNWKRPG